MNSPIMPKRTCLFPLYERYAARLVVFGGWEMPVQYAGILEEHRTVRTRAGLFDVSHMGEIWIEGERALEAVQHLTVNDASRLADGQAQYSAMANFEGGLVDDITVFRFASDRYLLCVNAATAENDHRWITAHLRDLPGVKVTDRSAETALLGLQGPLARTILGRLTYADLEKLGYFRFVTGRVAGIRTVISRTGYTGEDGFELFVDVQKGPDLWEELMAMGEPEGLAPCGLGSRDTLRLEMGYLLYGQDIDDTTSPLEAGLEWITKTEKGDFIGREAIERLRAEGIGTVLAAFTIEGRGIPRQGYPLLHGGRVVGRVTSGTLSPSLNVGIGLGYVPREASVPGTRIDVLIRDREVAATVVSLPFYRSGSAKKKPSARKEA